MLFRSVMAQGAVGACVNIGGDLRVVGQGPEGRGWSVRVEHPLDATKTAAMLWLSRGAVATSATNRRRWVCADGTEQHHLIDPSTGTPVDSPWSGITVIAGSACRAEVFATAGMVAGATAIDMFNNLNVDALLIDSDGIATAVGQAASFLA